MADHYDRKSSLTNVVTAQVVYNVYHVLFSQDVEFDCSTMPKLGRAGGMHVTS